MEKDFHQNISLHFSLAEDDEEEHTEFRYYLLNGFCMDAPYDMTVTDRKTGKVLQERRVSLSIELPDTITYPDLNVDGYADMRIGAPVLELPKGAEPEDWEAFQAETVRCSEELCPGRVSNLTFEKYHMEDGCDLYGYCFEYDTGEEIIEYVDFFKFGKANMSEVIGVRRQEPNTVLVNTVRYIAASFTDYGGEGTI